MCWYAYKKRSLKVDLSFVNNSVREILKYAKNKKIIVTKSTVPVGSGDPNQSILKKRKNYLQ